MSYPYFSGYAHEQGAGAGEGFNANYPMGKGTRWAQYKPALQDALKRIVAHKPQFLVVSLGVDTFEDDPISHFKLTSEDFLRMGAEIASAGIPTLFVMEGGYMVDEIGINAVNTCKGSKARANPRNQPWRSCKGLCHGTATCDRPTITRGRHARHARKP